MRSWRSFAILGVLAVLVAGLIFAPGGGAAAGPPGDPPGLQQAIAAQEAHTQALLAVDGVVGTGVGVGPQGAAEVVIFTERGGVAGLPAALDGVRARVVVSGPIVALHHRPGHGGGPGGGGDEEPPTVDPTGRFPRPVPIGVSTGHPAVTAGTIGARVLDAAGNVYALSNNHVYADENRASLGDPVIQPGSFDGGVSPADDIGTLAAFVPIDFSGGDNTVDAAIATSSTALLGNSTPAGGYGTPAAAPVEPSFNLSVQKYGRTTGLTSSRIAYLNVTVQVQYDQAVARFVGQFAVRGGGFSRGGDSGALIVTAQGNQPVGLLFAGGSGLTFANPIGEVLTAFGVSIDGS